MAYETKQIGLQEWIYVRWKGELIKTTVGRVIFNMRVPRASGITSSSTASSTRGRSRRRSRIATAATATPRRRASSTRSRTSASTTRRSRARPCRSATSSSRQSKYEIVGKAQDEVDGLHRLYEQGFISQDEQYNKTIDIWSKASDEVTTAMQAAQNPLNPVFMMATSGARGSIAQVKQLGGMRGLMSDPSGRILEIPVKASLKEGLTVLEYFISTHGARKGLADTALRTADSGYLTRRLVDVAQDVIIREEDCGTSNGIMVSDIRVGKEVIEPLHRPHHRPACGRGSASRSQAADDGDRHRATTRSTKRRRKALIDAGIAEVKIRSVLTCQSKYGVCSLCYGRDLAAGNQADIGTAVGIIAAQSIGEPGTQLTLRTFHTGGVATEDIITGLPRVEEIFEARKPKGQATISEVAGIDPTSATRRTSASSTSSTRTATSTSTRSRRARI